MLGPHTAESYEPPILAGGREPGTHSRLSIQTVFIPRENIFFLREWLAYHSLVGIDHFYLYENSGSTEPHGRQQRSIAVDGLTKYDIDVRGLSCHLSDSDLHYHLDRILERFPGQVTLVEWRPRDENGQICYGQTAAVQHCIGRFGSESDWFCFIDIDEFLFSPSEESISRLLDEMDSTGTTRVVIEQKKFRDRFSACAAGRSPYVTASEECIEAIDRRLGGGKCIVRSDAFLDAPNIHGIRVERGKSFHDRDGTRLRFNHYNVNDVQLRWIEDRTKPDPPPRLSSLDPGMRRYAEAIRRLCPPSEQIRLGPTPAADVPSWARGRANREILRACLDEERAFPLGNDGQQVAPELRALLPLLETYLAGRPRQIASKRRLATLAKSSVLLERALRAVEHLQANGIAVVVLKGAALLHSAYDNRIDLRPMSDVDLLVRPDEFDRATQLMQDAGWKLAGPRMLKVRLHFDHGLHFFREGGSVDLHRRPFPEGDLWDDHGGVMDRAIAGELLGHPVSIPSPTDLFTHTCIHGIGSLGRALEPRWVVDTARLLGRHDIDWPAARARTEPSGVTFLMGRALRWLTRLGVDLPVGALARFSADPTGRREEAVEIWRDGGTPREGAAAWLQRARAVALCTQPPGEQNLDLIRALRLTPAYVRYVLDRPSLRDLPAAARKRLRRRRRREQKTGNREPDDLPLWKRGTEGDSSE